VRVPDSRVSSKPLVGLLAAVASFAVAAMPSAASAFSPYLVVPEPAVAEASPAYRYANMTDGEAFAELDRRRLLYSRIDPVPGVRAPIRLTGRLHGVNVHSSLPPDQRVVSPYEILDARLALALDDFCALLERHDVDEVVHYTMYRPNVAAPAHGPPDEGPPVAAVRASGARPRPEATKARPALGAKGVLDTGKGPPHAAPPGAKQKGDDGAPKQTPGPASPQPARPGIARAKPVARVARRDPTATGLHQTTWAPPGTRHPAGLAIDVALLHKRDGRWLSVQRDFHGRIGVKTCGEGAPVPESPDARELHALVCESSELGIFTYVLTPDYNAAHADHFHMEIKPGVRWFLYH
jgi:Extensin-like protein C-terminus